MTFKHKFSYEEKVKILSEYLEGTYGFREVCFRYNINQGSLKDWKRLYETFGWYGLKSSSEATHYSKQVKEAAVLDYRSHRLTVPDILKKYKIRSSTQLRRWIKKYNSHESLNSSGTGGHEIMTKGKKTTLYERVEIVEYCIAHDRNYAQTAEKFGVSYQQARSYTIKYEASGIEGLKDGRGRRKSEDEMSEFEKLQAENRILRAQKEQAEMEASFLKKLAEIERR